MRVRVKGDAEELRDVLVPVLAERGTPSSWMVDLRMVRPCVGGEDGGMTMRKSSSR